MLRRILAALKQPRQTKLWGREWQPGEYPPGMPEHARPAFDRMKTHTYEEVLAELDSQIEEEKESK